MIKKVEFSLRDLRTSKGLSQKQLAQVLKISTALYSAIEAGNRKPTIDALYTLTAVYGTSMDFIYHAYYRQHVIWHFPEHDLKYALDQAKMIDIHYLAERFPPDAPPQLPDVLVLEHMPGGGDGGEG